MAELAFARRATMDLHSSPNSAWLVIVEGGGWVQVGDEQARVWAGEAVLWPAGVEHAARTELSEMRAFLVEFAGADDAAAREVPEGRRLELPPGGVATGQAGPAGLAAPRSTTEAAPGTGVAASTGTAVEGEPL